MAKTLRDLLSGIENAAEVERVIKQNLRDEDCKLFIDDGVENIYIPKSRLDAKIAELKSANATIDSLNGTIDELKANKGGDEKTAETIKNLKAQIKAHEGEMKALQINNALDLIARDKKAKDIDVLKALIDMSKVSVDTNGQVLGLAEQVDALVESKAYLFDVDDAPNFFGGTGAPGKPNNENIFGSKTQHAGDFGRMLAQQNNNKQADGNQVDSDYFFK